MLAYDHGSEELEAKDQHVVIPIPVAPMLKEISALHYHNKKAYILLQGESWEQHKVSLPKLAKP